jgi:hypothetical protein
MDAKEANSESGLIKVLEELNIFYERSSASKF